MNAPTSATSPAIYFFNGHQRRRIAPQKLIVITSSFSSRRRRRPFNPNHNPKPSPSDQRDVNLSLDLQDVADRASSTLTCFVKSSNEKLRKFLNTGAEAFDDLRTSVRIDPGHRIAFSCRRSSIHFVANLLIWGLAVVITARVLIWMRLGLGFGNGWAVVRRDRSLGGREVVVGRRRMRRGDEKKEIRVSVNPLSDFEEIERRVRGNLAGKQAVKKEEKLPEWWPESVTISVGLVGDEELKREANRLVRGLIS